MIEATVKLESVTITGTVHPLRGRAVFLRCGSL
jgi:hypothetical protein